MADPDSTPTPQSLESKALIWLVVIVTIAFLWILAPYLGAVLWAVAAALVFAPLYRRLVRAFHGRTTLAALASVALIFLLVILPLLGVSALLAQEVSGLYKGLESGEVSIAKFFQQFLGALPAWATNLLESFGLAHEGALQERITTQITKSSQKMAEHALSVGQNTFEVVVEFFVMLYLIFFLMRDGAGLSRRIKEAIPLRSDDKRELSEKFTTVIRATVKGNIVVALIQGALGGLALWVLGIHAPVLWGVVMAFLSLLPAIGAAIVWLPVAAWLLATGAIWKAVALIAWGVLVIGLIDNLLRPVLVGKDTRMPDYVVLLATLGGMTFFGINGFVIGPLVAAMFMATWHIFSVRRAVQR
jgi:predicted PurR-regulated permease PerM